jgi:hypothetical protein
MRLGEDYGVRLNQKFSNLKQSALTQLSQSYSSHGFVIDLDEASALFERVRQATAVEKSLVQVLGSSARFPGENVKIENLTDLFERLTIDASERENERDTAQPNEHGPEHPFVVHEGGEGKPNGDNLAAAE